MPIIKRKVTKTVTDKQTTQTVSRLVVAPLSGRVVTVSDITITKGDKETSYRRLYPSKATKKADAIKASDKAFAERKVGKKTYSLTDEGLIDFSQLM